MQLSRLALARNALDQLCEPFDHQHRPGDRGRMHVARWASLFLGVPRVGREFIGVFNLVPRIVVALFSIGNFRRHQHGGHLNLRPVGQQLARALEPIGHAQLGANIGDDVLDRIRVPAVNTQLVLQALEAVVIESGHLCLALR